MNINPKDLVIVSDTGDAYVVRFNPRSGASAPKATIEWIDDASIAEAAVNTADEGVLVANLPQNALGGGCTCFLLNLRDLAQLPSRGRPASPAPPVTPAPALEAMETVKPEARSAKKATKKGTR